jgi:hypothetical protein
MNADERGFKNATALVLDDTIQTIVQRTINLLTLLDDPEEALETHLHMHLLMAVK